MIAALYVQEGGCYYGLEGVDPWPESRDARLYPGPHPVVAHPPCSRWCQLAGLVEARYGYKKGDDGGCFAAALEAVRLWGGVLEHPAFSSAWPAFGLPRPHSRGFWSRTFCGGWVASVDQGHYGHQARKSTWLYAHGIEEATLPQLRKGTARGRALVSWCRNRAGLERDTRPRVGKMQAAKTPLEFRDLLLEIARSARRVRTA